MPTLHRVHADADRLEPLEDGTGGGEEENRTGKGAPGLLYRSLPVPTTTPTPLPTRAFSNGSKLGR